MARITGPITNGITLSTNGAYASPLTITGTGSVVADDVAIYGPDSQPWTVVNAGTISAGPDYGIGIELASGGAVLNTGSAATIEGSRYGIRITFNDNVVVGFVENAGTISGGLAGITLNAQESEIFNGSPTETGAQVSGGTNGIYVSSQYPSHIYNYGTITGTAGSGVVLNDGGSLVNGPGGDTAAVISGGQDGLSTNRAPATIANYGTITATGTAGIGVNLGAGGTIVNGSAGDTAARIAGVTGVTSGAGFILTNYGTVTGIGTGITAASGVAVWGQHGGEVVNAGTAASIEGSRYGVYFYGAVGTVINDGTIRGDTYAGIVGGDGAAVTNGSTADLTAEIAGGGDGISLAAGIVTNYGTIQGGNGAGVAPIDSGSVINGSTAATAAQITGYTGISSDGSVTVTNRGTITGTGAGTDADGIYSHHGGIIQNLGTAAEISGTGFGVYFYGGHGGAAGTVTSEGTIKGTSYDGISAGFGGAITNGSTTATAALIQGAAAGVDLSGGTVTNYGTITGTGAEGVGIEVTDGGTVRNDSATALISGTSVGVLTDGAPGAVVNYGAVTGTDIGVSLEDGGAVGNYGTIEGTGTNAVGIKVDGSAGSTGTVTNYGLIAGTGTGDAIQFAGGIDRLILYPGAEFIGTVDGGGGTSTLELASATNIGTISGIGTQFIGFSSIVVDSGADWVLTGSDTIASGVTLTNNSALDIAGSLVNNGVILGTPTVVTGGTVDNTGTIRANTAGYAGIVLSSTGGDTLTNSGTIAGDGADAVLFGSGNDRLIVDPGAVFTGVVDGGPGQNTLELAGSVGSYGTIAGLGTQFRDFQNVTVDAGAYWALNGNNTIASGATVTVYGTLVSNHGLVDNGTLIDNGRFANYGALTGTGTLSVSSGILLNGIGGSIGLQVTLGSGGYLFNYTGGRITAASGIAVVGTGAGVSLTNLGTISSPNGSVGIGVSLGSGGTVSNGPSGVTTALILGSEAGLLVGGAAGTVANAGTITGGNDGVSLDAGGTISNAATGVISSDDFAVAVAGAAGTVTNAGTIESLNFDSAGVDFTGTFNDTVVNSGTIIGDLLGSGANGNSVLFGAGNDRLVVDPGAMFVGTADGGAGTNTLELGGSGRGTIANLTSKFHNFQTIVSDTGVYWELTGTTAPGTGVSLTNNGTLSNFGRVTGAGAFTDNGSFFNGGYVGLTTTLGAGGYLANTGTLKTTGTPAIVDGTATGATVVNAGTIAATGADAIQFGAGNDLLVVNPGAVFTGTVDGGGGSNTLEFTAGTGTITGIGSTFVDFENLVVDTGGTWTLPGTVSFADVTNRGTLEATGTLTVTGTLTNSGSLGHTTTLAGGAYLDNTATGLIDVADAPALYGIGGPSTVINTGAITSAAGFGIDLTEGGQITNGSTSATGASIYGSSGDVHITGGAGSIVNFGTIETVKNPASFVIGVDLLHGGSVTNGASGFTSAYIYGSAGAVAIYGGAGTVTNYGTIITHGTYVGEISGVALGDGAVVNGSTAVTAAYIYGYSDGVRIIGTATVSNFGTIAGSGNTLSGSVGVYIAGGGSVVNGSTAVTTSAIKGGWSGVEITGAGDVAAAAGTVINFGTITGGSRYGIDLLGGGQVVNGSSDSTAALIRGPAGGVYIAGAAGTVTNSGTVTSSSHYGIDLLDGGQVTNGSSGSTAAFVYGRAGGVRIIGSVGTVANFGTIKSAYDTTLGIAGVILGAGGSFTNGASTATGAYVYGYNYGVLIAGGTGTVANFGTIRASDTGLHGVVLEDGGSVTNGATGSTAAYIYGGEDGIVSSGAAATVTNYGKIVGRDIGVYLRDGGAVLNGSSILTTAEIYGGESGVEIAGGAGAVTNFGTILSNTYPFPGNRNAAVVLVGGGSVANLGTAAQITGAYYGLKLQGGSDTVTNYGTIEAVVTGGLGVEFAKTTTGDTLTNAGTIAGDGGDAVLFGNGNDRLIVEPGAVFVGAVEGAGGTNTLEFGSAASVGTISGLGTEYLDFGTIVVDSGARWGLANGTTIAAGVTLTNDGTLTNSGTLTDNGSLLNDGTLTNNGTLTGSGTLTVGPGTMINSGYLGVSLTLDSGSYLDNTATGTISAPGAGAVVGTGGPVSVTNYGTIEATGTGGIGIDIVGTGDSTVTNAGTIAGDGGDAILFGAGDDRLIVDPGAVFVGTVDGGGGTLEFAPGSGTITGLGTSFAGFTSIIVDAGANWTLSGTNTIASGVTVSGAGTLIDSGTLVNEGTIGIGLTLASGATLDNTGTITGPVGVAFGTAASDGIVTSAGRITGTGGIAIKFDDGNDTLIVDAGAVFVGKVMGGLGNDTVEFESAGKISFGNFSGFETIGLASGGANTLALKNANFAGVTGKTITIDGGSGGNTIGAGAVTGTNRVVLIGGAGEDVFKGGAGNDVFEFSAANLSAKDKIVGGAGSDELLITTAGTINAGGVSGVETYKLANGGANTLTLTNANFAGVTHDKITVDGGSGGNTINASALTGSNKVVLVGGAGNDAFTGGAGNDIFEFSAANLEPADTVVGGLGSDELLMTTAGIVNAEGVSGVETYKLANGGANTLTLTNGNFAGVTGNKITVKGGSGGNTIDASELTGSHQAVLDGGAGNDVLIAGQHETMTGGAGSDTFIFTTPGTLAAPDTNSITDFAPSTDKIAFSDAGFHLGLAGASSTLHALPSTLFTSNSTGSFTSAAQRFAYDSANGDLYYDAQGDKAGSSVQLVATLAGDPSHPTLSAGDLFFVS